MQEKSPEIPKIKRILREIESLSTVEKAEVVKELQLNEAAPATSTKKKRKFDDLFKDKAVSLWKQNRNFLATADQLTEELNEGRKEEEEEQKCYESYVRRWVTAKVPEDEIKRILKKPKLTKDKAHYPELEQMLVAWFKGKRESKLCVTLKQFQDKAVSIFNDLKKKYENSTDQKHKAYSEGSFKGSHGWFERFRDRNKISRRVATHVASKLAEGYSTEIAKFIGRVRELRYVIGNSSIIIW
jgi:hypothetical protein